MLKLNELNVLQLKKILRKYELSTAGIKSELVDRLADAIGTDEISQEELTDCCITDVERMQKEIDTLKAMLSNVVETVKNIAISPSTATNSSMACAQRSSATDAQDIEDEMSVHNSNTEQSPDIPSERMPEPNETTVRPSVRDLISILPEFDPSAGQQSAQQFIAKVDSLRTVYGWPDQLVLYAVHDKLKGHAKIWLDSQDVFLDWKQFVMAFQTDFPSEINTADIHIEMVKRVQGKNELMNDYYYSMLAKGRQGKLDDQSIIRHVINGLSDENVRKTLNAMQFKRCPDLCKALSGFGSSTQVGRKRNDHVEEVNSIIVKKPIGDPKCFNCREVGHFANKCPKPKNWKCPRCNKRHTKEYNCQAENKVRSIELKSLISMEVTVNVGIKQFAALLDTGSECCLVRKSISKQLNCELEKCRMRIVGICGGTQYADEKSRVDVEINGVIMSLEFYVVADEMLEHDILLGQNLFLDPQLQWIIDMNGVNVKRLSSNKTTTESARVFKLSTESVRSGLDNEHTKEQLYQTLTDYSNVFAEGLHEIGKTELVRMKIELNSDKVIAQKPYRVPEPKQPIVKDMLDELLRNDIITPSESGFASPMLLVKKKDGRDRLCIDYRRLNSITKKETFPLPNIEESLQEAAKYKLFTVLDLNSGYYQVEIDPESRQYTAFITTEGLYEFKRMPFGLANAPIVFLRLMSKINERVGRGTMLHYMDDVLIGANTEEEMFEKLRKVLEVLSETGLTLNISKCEFFKKSVMFLGHELTAEGIKPGGPKTAAIVNFERPKNVTDLRRFLGLSGYFRKFVPGYSLISEPLRKLLKKDAIFRWTAEQEEAMTLIKNKLITEPVLIAYCVQADHEIHTDASKIGIAGVLLQRDGAQLKPVAYFSRATSENEAKFHSFELEALAVVESVERFRYYVCGKKVKVVTDCNAVKATMEKKELIPRIGRWWLRIQDFDIEMEHRAGRRMEHVDALSRAPNEPAKESDVATLRIDKVTLTNDDFLFSMQLQDQHIKDIIQKLDDKDKQTMLEYECDKGRLFRKVKGRKLWVVPKSIRWHMLRDCHDKNGHLGVDKTLERLTSYAWFARMRNFTKSYIGSCVECAYNKSKGGKREGNFHFDDMEPIPFKTVHLDHLGPFPKTAKRNEHILVMVDSFTKYTILKAVKSTASKFVLIALNDMTSYFGIPQRIVTDRGTAFTSNDFAKYCHDNDIQHVQNAVRTPRANGHAERTNRTLISMLTTTTINEKQWDQHLTNLQWTLNTMKNATTGKTPHELLFSYNPRDILQNKVLLALADEFYTDSEEMVEKRREAAERVSDNRMKQKERIESKLARPIEYKVGDLVLAGNEPAATGTSRKLEPKYKGPFIITRVLGRDRYVIEDLPNSRRTNRHYSSVYASDGLKPWCKLPYEIDDTLNESEEADESE